MFIEKLKDLMKVNLKLFDGEGGESGTPIQGTPSQGSETVVNAPQQNQSPISRRNQDPNQPKVIYGKVEDSTMGIANPPQGTNPEAERLAQYQNFKEDFKDLHGKDVESIIKDRFKKYNGIEQQLGQYDPLVSLVKEKYKTDDLTQLHAKLQEELFETLAETEEYDGLTIEQIRQIETTKRENAELRNRFDSQEQEKVINQKIADWYKQADELKAEYPDFNLDDHANNEKFVKLLDAGIDVKTAYEITNIDTIKANVAKKMEQNVVQNIQAKGLNRPKENGLNTTPGVIVKSDPSKFTKQDRLEIARRAKMGESIKL